jgi:hypothetical protein
LDTYCHLLNGTNQTYPGGSSGKPLSAFVITRAHLPRINPTGRPSEQDKNDTALIACKRIKVLLFASHEVIRESGAIFPRILTWALIRN